MSFVGHTDTVNFLNKLLVDDKLPHLLVFSGKPGIGKKTFATIFAKSWIGGGSLTPDLYIYSPEGKLGLHTIQSVKEMIEKLSFLPYQGNGVCIIIDDAERMLPASANALLKTIEEPPPRTLIIMITSALNDLIPTIRSRGQLVRFQPLKEEEVSYILQTKYGKDEESARIAAKKANGSVSRAIEQMSIPLELDKLKEIFRSNSAAQIFSFSAQLQEIFEERKKAIQALESVEEDQIKWLQEVDFFFEDLYFLMRDLILESSKDKVSALIKVEEALSFSKLQLRRSTPFLQTMENLLLHLQEALHK